MRPDSPFSSPNPHRLYRNPAAGKLFGVCAGLADFFGAEPFLVRAGVVVALIFFSAPVIIAYLLAALILPARPATLYRSPAEEEFWRAVATKPQVTLATVRNRFRDLERRLRNLESHVTSREFELGQAIRDLDRGRRPRS